MVLQIAIAIMVGQFAAVGVKPAFTIAAMVISSMGEEEAARYILADGLAILRAPHVLDVVQHVLVVVVAALVWMESIMATGWSCW